MKILYIVTEADRGGAQKYVLSLSLHFQGEIAAGNTSPELFAQAKELDIKTYSLSHLKRQIDPINDFLSLFEIYKLVKKINPDIVHLNSSKAGFLGSIAAKLAGKKVVFTAHGFFFFENVSWLIKITYTFLERFASLFRDHIIAVSDHDRENAIKYRIISPDEISTVHNGLPQIDFITKEKAREKFGLKDEFAIVNIAQYYHRKGLDILINAINLLSEDIKRKIKVMLIGDGPERKKLSSQIEKLKLNNQIKLIGNIANADRYLKGFDLFILSSRVEGFPFVLLEALQAQIPIIATDVGGNKEALDEAGLVVETNNTNTLSAAIAKIFQDESFRQSIISNTLRQSSLFSEEKMFDETQKIYQKLL